MAINREKNTVGNVLGHDDRMTDKVRSDISSSEEKFLRAYKKLAPSQQNKISKTAYESDYKQSVKLQEGMRGMTHFDDAKMYVAKAGDKPISFLEFQKWIKQIHNNLVIFPNMNVYTPDSMKQGGHAVFLVGSTGPEFITSVGEGNNLTIKPQGVKIKIGDVPVWQHKGYLAALDDIKNQLIARGIKSQIESLGNNIILR